ncbi:MAG: glycoside hydrolase family 65 protein [Solirubrobacterales bacterium]|nr:glycoside hydrolase family 65 protein [Solirubrobacterales bacterium]
MIQHPAFVVDPWTVRESALDLEYLAQTESLFALANGHVGLRANLDEGEPSGQPGTYLAGFYETRPLPYAEAEYGSPEDGQTVVNVTNGKIIRLAVGDEPFDVRYGELRKHERILDLRAGLLRRTAEWVSPTGRLVRVTSTRIVSLTQRSVAAILYEVEPLDDAAQVVVQSELITNETLPTTEQDPRAAAALTAPLVSDLFQGEGLRAMLVHTTKASKLTVGAAMDHLIDAPDDTTTAIEAYADIARLSITATPAPGKPLRITKFLAYSWSGSRTIPAVRDQVAAALVGAVHTGWDRLLAEQRELLDEFWEAADIEIEGDTELQQAVRFALFHVLQAGERGEQRLIPAKGLTGPGYDGHTFWDTEAFLLPVLTYSRPRAVADALRWRHSTLDLARERARSLGLRGAAFPWRTIHGEECSGYWPASTAAFHINAAIANAVERYQRLSEDETFEREAGLELLVETARLWRSLGHHDGAGRFRIDGVTGPDEYSAVADNNVYTNLMAARNLRAAADAIERHPDLAKELAVDAEEAASWRDAADGMLIPYDESLGVHPQSEGFTEHQVWDFDSTPAENYPLMFHYPYFDLYRSQVVKQADLVLALFYAGDAFTAEEKARDFVYYERLTVRDSSLSACIQAVVAAEVGHVELAYDYFAEAALIDLHNLEHNTRDGVHVASLAGSCIAAIAGFGGLRDRSPTLAFLPRLPRALTRLSFAINCGKETKLRIEVEPRQATYTLLRGEALPILHHGRPFTVTSDQPVRCPIPAPRALERATQPRGRAPARAVSAPAHDLEVHPGAGVEQT